MSKNGADYFVSGRERSYKRDLKMRDVGAELLAAIYLIAKGYRIIGWRARTSLGEIDLIACKGAILAFVEVKRVKGGATLQSRGQIMSRAALWYGARENARKLTHRFDVVTIRAGLFPLHLPGAYV